MGRQARPIEVGLEAPASAYGLGILPPLTAVLELTVIVGFILLLDWIWPALDINALQPNPYWLPVLLLTLQYGTASGSLAVIVAIIAYFTFVALPEQGVGENEFSYRLRILAQPILWIATAVLLGQFRMVQIAAKRDLTRRVSELDTQRATLGTYAQRLRQRCDALELAIATRTSSPHSAVLDALATLVPHENEDAHDAMTRCIETLMPDAKLSLFIAYGNALHPVLSTREDARSSKPDAVIAASHPVYESIVQSRKAVSVLTADGEKILSGQGLVAVPVLAADGRSVLGMIRLDDTPSKNMSEHTQGHLAALALLLAPSLARVTTGRGQSNGGYPGSPHREQDPAPSPTHPSATSAPFQFVIK